MYDFDNEVSRLHTYSTKWDYIADRFKRSDIIPFSISDTDFITANEIIVALEQRVEHRIFGYSRWNHDDFKTSIRNWFQSRFQATIDPQWITYTPNVIYALSVMIQLQSKPKQHVVVLSPMYDAFFAVIQQNDRQLLENKLQFNPQTQQFEIDWALLEAQLADPTTAIFLLTNPHNPTGRVWCQDELHKIYQLCQCYQVFLISDDIHMDVVYQPYVYQPITTIGSNNLCLISSNSKSFNVPGLGGAYLFIPDAELQQRFLQVLKRRDGLSSPSILGMTALITGYNQSANYIDELLSYLTDNRQLIIDFIAKYLPNVHLAAPQGTYLAWIDVSGLACDAEVLQKALVEYGKVGIMSGASYGDSQFLRLNFACTRRHLLLGLEGLRQAINVIKPAK